MRRLEGKVAVVTGAGSGNGRGIAVRFAQDGAKVVIADIDQAGMEESAALVKGAGGEALTERCDVTSKAAIDAMIAAAVAHFGRIDIVVANAGVGDRGATVLNMTEEQFDRTIAVNLKGVFFTLQAGANQIRRQGGGGRLIAIASIMSELGSPFSGAYTATKGGVRQLVKSFAMALGHHGITCNAIGPGYIHTPMLAPLEANEARRTDLLRSTPAGRLGEPEDVAAVAAFLAGDETSFITGTTMYTDGGVLAGHYFPPPGR